MKKIFAKFDKGETNEEILKHYAKNEITVPEQFLVKARKQYEGLKKAKLEMEFAEQEAKDIVTTKIPDVVLFDLEDEDEKRISSGIYQEKK